MEPVEPTSMEDATSAIFDSVSSPAEDPEAGEVKTGPDPETPEGEDPQPEGDIPDVFEEVDGSDSPSPETSAKDGDVAEIFKLDPRLAENPELRKRWDDQNNGLLKEKQRYEARSAEFQPIDDMLHGFKSPDHAPIVLKKIAESVAKGLGRDLNEFISEAFGVEVVPPAWEYEGEQRLASQLSDTERRLLAKVDALEARETVREQQAQQAAKAQKFDGWYSANAETVSKGVSAITGKAHTLTKEIVSEAIRMMPDKSIPVAKKVAAYLTVNKVDAPQAKKAVVPSIIDGQGAKGVPIRLATNTDQAAELAYDQMISQKRAAS